MWIERVGIESNKIIYIHHHLGLGDHIVCFGLVKKLIQEYSDVEYDIVLAVKNHNYDTVKHLYEDTNIKLDKILDDSEAEWAYTPPYIPQKRDYQPKLLPEFYKPRNIPGRDLKCLRIGFTERYVQSNPEDWEKSFYEQCKIDYKERWNSFYFKSNKDREDKLIQQLNLPEKFAFVNRATSAQKHDIEIDTTLPIIELEVLTPSILDWAVILQKANEIHTVDSSIFHLIKQLKLNKRKVFYDIKTQDDSRGYFTFEDDKWEIKTIE